MQIVNEHQIFDAIDFSDIALRTASQIRLAQRGKRVRDSEAMERAIVFLDAAIDGGQFVFSGNGESFHASLKPLTWAADIHMPNASSKKDLDAYRELADYLRNVKSALVSVMEEKSSESQDDAIAFFQGLGDYLALRADQGLRRISNETSTIH